MNSSLYHTMSRGLNCLVLNDLLTEKQDKILTNLYKSKVDSTNAKTEITFLVANSEKIWQDSFYCIEDIDKLIEDLELFQAQYLKMVNRTYTGVIGYK